MDYAHWKFYDWTNEFADASVPVSLDGTFDGNWQRLIHSTKSETEKETLRHYELLSNTAVEMTKRLSTIDDVEKVILFGSLAKPPFRTWSPYPKKDWTFHKPKDIDLAVWVASLKSIETIRHLRSELVRTIQPEHTDILTGTIELFLFDSKSSKYLGRVCCFKKCPRGNNDCLAKNCGSPPFLKQMDDFKIALDALLRFNTQILFERETIAAIPDSNLLMNLPQVLPEEFIETLVSAKNIRIERIVSTGHFSPPDFWYDQDENEFVVVLQGNAVLEFENKTLALSNGNYVLIPAHKKHRVRSTSLTEPTVWLAVFFI